MMPQGSFESKTIDFCPENKTYCNAIISLLKLNALHNAFLFEDIVIGISLFSLSNFVSYVIECNMYIMFCCILPFQDLVVITHLIESYRGKGLGARIMGCTATMW